MTQSHHGMPCWYELATSDPDAAQAFYAPLMGWSWADAGMPGMDYRLASTPQGMVAGMMKAEPGMPLAWTCYTAVDSADDTAALAASLGASIIVPPADIPGTGRFALLIDPQGAAFGILQPLPMADGSGSRAFDQQQMGHGNWSDLVSPDPAAANEFYGKLFGWTVSRSMQMGPGMTYHILARDGLDIGGTYSDPANPRTMWKPYFGVPSAKAAATQIAALGGKVLHGPDPVPGGAFIVQLSDPQGVLVAISGMA